MSATFWLILGFFGQALFSARFLVQWLASERAKRSIIPLAFWYFSIAGGLTLFAYALYRQDPVFIAGQGLGVFIYARNLYLIHRESQGSREPVLTADDRPAADSAEAPREDLATRPV